MDTATRKMVLFGVIGLVLAGSVIAVVQVAPSVLPNVVTPILAKDGTFAIYFASAPSDFQASEVLGPTNAAPFLSPAGPSKHASNITSLVVTIDEVMVHTSGSNGNWTISHGSVTVDLLKPTSVPTLIVAAKVPAGNITLVRLHILSANATVRDSSGKTVQEPVVVSSGMLEVPLTAARVMAQLTTTLVLDRPHIVVEGNGTIRLTPALHVDVTGPK